MRMRVTWSAAESLPDRAEVLALQGVPAELVTRFARLLEDAEAIYLASAEARAVLEELPGSRFREVYAGDGRNAPGSPLADIFPRAERLALYVATVGGGIGARIRGLFDGNQPALAATLDAVASAAADGLATRLAARFLATGPGAGRNGTRVLPYSPGYCGWHVSGQRALFAALEPAEIGVTLNPSCLMQPLKSVSGVLVEGPLEIHRFAPSYPFCPECAEKPCRERIRSLSRS